MPEEDKTFLNGMHVGGGGLLSNYFFDQLRKGSIKAGNDRRENCARN